MKWILSVLIVACFSNTFARDIFVGGSGASDNNTGTATQPFATIQKAASVAVAGDVVIIRAGTYRETIVPTNSGVTYRNDNGAIVTISGLNEITTPWTLHSGQIYKTTVTLPVSNNISAADLTSNTTIMANQIFKDGTMMHLARWPKVSTPEDLLDRTKFRYHRETVSFGATSVTDNGLPSTGNLAGAHINILGWFFTQTRQITARSGNTITYPAVTSDLHFVKWYYITNHIDLLTQAKEWFYSGGILYFWQNGGGSPTGVEYKARNWGFDLRGKSNVTIIGLHFIGCEPMTGNTSSNNITLDNIRARYQNHAFTQQGGDLIYRSPRMHGMKMIGSNCVVKNSEFKYSASQMIWAGPNCLIQNNLASDVGYEGNYGAFVTPYVDADGIRVMYNTVSRVCRSMVDFGCDGPDQGGAQYGGSGSHLNMEIGYNIFHTHGMLNTDGGATYGARGTNITGTVIHHNWIYNHTAKENWQDHGPEPYDWYGIHPNIYFDQGCGPATIHHNVLWDGATSDTYRQSVYGRTYLWYNNTFASTAPQCRESYTTWSNTPSDVFRNNIFVNSLNVNWAMPGNIANSILKTTDPKFVGPLRTGLGYRLQSTSPAINAGVIIPGITDGSVGAPDIGAYEFGGTAWVPGYNAVTTTPPTNTPPGVSITAPANNSSVTQGTAITISANATDADGTIARVEFFNGTTKLGEDTSSPYSFGWNNAPAGTHTLTARATDNANAVTTSAPVSVTVTANTTPNVSITAPANNATITSGTAITITATASVPSGSITKVEFFDGATKLGEDAASPYNFVWNGAALGTHILTARATNDTNGTATSAAVNITVSAANTAPVVSLTAPTNNSQFTPGSPITLTATASDSNGTITKVEFFDGTTKLGEDLTSPYSFAWNNATDGTHNLTAKATDNGGLATTSTSVKVTVKAANIHPSVRLTKPGNNARFAVGSGIDLTADASDADGSVTKVEFFDGSTKLGEDLTSPYSLAWSNAAEGTHVLTVKATDNVNVVATSAAVTIAVTNSTNTLPVVSITAPLNNSQFISASAITITATASDTDGTVTKVEFFDGLTKVGEDLTNPYSFIWTNVSSGNHALTARATDNLGGIASSATINISVADPGGPTVEAGEDVFLTLPENSSTLEPSVSSDVPVEYNWTQVDGPNAAAMSDPTAQSISVSNLIEGTYIFEFSVTNANGLNTTDRISVTVVAGSTAAASQSGIPRFFSPNDDGTGDYWEWLDVEPFEDSLLSVYNRSGQKIYETVSYNNTWDGKMNGEPLQAGDYYYIIQMGDATDIKGAVRIIR